MKSLLKSWKFSLTLLAATLSANSTFVWAANATQAEKNKMFRQQVLMEGQNLNQAYRQHASLIDPAGQAALESWLENFGTEKFPTPSVQNLKNGQIKLVSSFRGKALTITVDEQNPQSVNINGQTLKVSELRNSKLVFEKLGATDKDMKLLAQQIDEIKDPKPQGLGNISVEEFIRLPGSKKVEYLMLLREMAQAAELVYAKSKATASSLETQGKPRAVASAGASTSDSKIENQSVADSSAMEASRGMNLAPWMAALCPSAWAAPAASAPLKLLGKNCVVAGHISIYERIDSRIACNPRTALNDPSTIAMRESNALCTAGTDTACNPLVYGYDNGRPFCLNSKNQPDFTEKATLDCNKMSPLTPVNENLKGQDKEKQELQRRKDMVRILQSYYLQKNQGDESALKGCFSDDYSQINAKCKGLFMGHLNAFHDYRDQTLEVCKTVELRDQEIACNAFRTRALEIDVFTDSLRPVTPLPKIDTCNVIGHWDAENKKCVCPDGSSAGKEEPFKCSPKPVAGVPERDRCKNEDGSQKNTFTCGKGPWLLIAAAGIAAWLFSRGGRNSSPPVVTTPGEGGNGTNPGNNGGTRKPTVPKGTQ